jgi:hypothetical protein
MSEAGHARVIYPPNLPVTLESRKKIARPLLTPVAQICTSSNMVQSRGERVFILEHYFASKSSSAVREAFSNAYPDKEVTSKTTIHRLVRTFRDTGSVCLWKALTERRNTWNYGRTDFKTSISCKNSIFQLFSLSRLRFTCIICMCHRPTRLHLKQTGNVIQLVT